MEKNLTFLKLTTLILNTEKYEISHSPNLNTFTPNSNFHSRLKLKGNQI